MSPQLNTLEGNPVEKDRESGVGDRGLSCELGCGFTMPIERAVGNCLRQSLDLNRIGRPIIDKLVKSQR